MRREHERQSTGGLRHRHRPVRITAAIGAAAVVATVGAPAAPAAGTFQRGDVLAGVGAARVIERFAGDGTSKGTLAGSSNAAALCFDRSGEHLVAPGAGLYDSAGNVLASNWASTDVLDAGSCTVDASGNVFVGGGPTSGDAASRRGTIRKFDLTGHLLHSYDVDATGFASSAAVYSVDLAPDQCTIYYALGGGDEIKRYNVCTDTPVAPFASTGVCDQLRVRPNGQVVQTCDTYGTLFDASGSTVHGFDNPTGDGNPTSLRFTALDPDGTTFLMGAYTGLVTRFDIASGQNLGSRSAGSGLSGLAVYDPRPAAPPNTDASLDPGGAATGADTAHGAPAQAPGIRAVAPALVVARGRLITSGRSLRLDTGLRVTCPAGGARCRATVVLTIATTGARAAAAARGTRVGTLRATVAPGATARLVVRFSKKGAALLRRRRTVTIAARATVRAGSGPAVVRKTSVRVKLR